MPVRPVAKARNGDFGQSHRTGKPDTGAGQAVRERGSARRSSDRPAGSSRLSAPFVAHLLATRMDLPQTRLSHRASPADADSAYRATAAATPHEPPARRNASPGKTI